MSDVQAGASCSPRAHLLPRAQLHKGGLKGSTNVSVHLSSVRSHPKAAMALLVAGTYFPTSGFIISV